MTPSPQALVHALASAGSGPAPASRRALDRLRAAARSFGPVGPWGDEGAKTGAPGTYRPVGPTCPATCPYLGHGCYAAAAGSPTNTQQRRASVDPGPSLRAAACAMVHAARTARLARLHVSGDVCRPGDALDGPYLTGLCALATAIRARFGREGPVAWTYTHVPRRRLGPWHGALLRAGIAVRFSDDAGPWGAIVAPFERVPALRRRLQQPLVKCPAQLSSDVTCQQCRLCWTRPALTIVFEPHGTSRAGVAAVTAASPWAREV